jgi:uncharacterized protein YcbX
VGGLWRYPVESLDGEQLDALTFDRRGVERLRPNVLIELGSARLRVTERVIRCVMVNHRRPTLRPRRDVLKLIGSINQACARVYADVVVPGEVRAGDPVALGPP